MPLILPIQRLNRPNPLAYPAGAVPGIDRSHPAARGLIVAATARAGWITNTATGLPATLQFGSSPNSVAAMDGLIGSALYNSTASTSSIGFAGPNVSANPVTFAAIFTVKAAAANGVYQTLVGINGLWGLYLKSDGTIVTPNVYTSADNPASFTLAVGDTFFLAASSPAVNTAGGVIAYVGRNLRTGKFFTATATVGLTFTRFDPKITFGEDSNEPSLSYIAAAMYGNTALSMQQLQQWSADPWAFWYPNKTINLASSAASAGGGGFLAAWARWINLPVIGTGNY